MTFLYGGISKNLSQNYNVIHIAYSDYEENILRKNYEISSIINFKKSISNILKDEVQDASLINKIDSEILEHTNLRFCLNSSIQSDRTYQYVKYEDILLLTQAYYKFWDNILFNFSKCILIHEIPALSFLHIASILCKKYSSQYLSQIQVRGDFSFSWVFAQGDDGYPIELVDCLSDNRINKERVDKYLLEFRRNFSLTFPELKKTIKKSNFVNNAFGIIKISLKHIRFYLQRPRGNDFSLIDHVEKYALYSRQKWIDEIYYHISTFYYLKFDTCDLSKKFYYYPMHVEPEAVILYWGDGIYKNQIKLIENIAAQLPPETFLYVKIHPLDKQNRPISDYLRIKAIPNVKLIDPEISSHELLKYSEGVITINGTTGFESILLNKPVIILGNSIYQFNKRVIYVHNVRDLRHILYELKGTKYQDDSDLYNFVNAFLNSCHPGFVLFFRDYKELFNIDLEKNSKIISEEITKYLNKFKFPI